MENMKKMISLFVVFLFLTLQCPNVTFGQNATQNQPMPPIIEVQTTQQTEPYHCTPEKNTTLEILKGVGNVFAGIGLYLADVMTFWIPGEELTNQYFESPTMFSTINKTVLSVLIAGPIDIINTYPWMWIGEFFGYKPNSFTLDLLGKIWGEKRKSDGHPYIDRILPPTLIPVVELPFKPVHNYITKDIGKEDTQLKTEIPAQCPRIETTPTRP